jgi:hypothetical protein
MRLVVKTQNPESLKSRIVFDVENGNLPTWELRTNKKDDKLLTHSGEQWVDKVLLRMTVCKESHQLIIETRYWSNFPEPSREQRGTILGRFCERLFVQYSGELESFIGET